MESVLPTKEKEMSPFIVENSREYFVSMYFSLGIIRGLISFSIPAKVGQFNTVILVIKDSV
jgi:hypothetical protein